jgi:hypothetical protein
MERMFPSQLLMQQDLQVPMQVIITPAEQGSFGEAS